MPVCIDDEIPFDIPESWEWVRLGALLQLVSDGTHKTPEYKESGVPFLSVQNISKGYFDLTKIKYVSEETHRELIKRIRPTKDDILLCRIGTLGKPIIVDIDFEFSIFVSLGLLRLIDSALNTWVISCINSPMGYEWIQEIKVGGGTHTFKLNLGDIPTLLMPLPPLEEQYRIQHQLESVKPLINQYDALESAREKLDAELPDRLRKSVLQMAVQGRLVSQDPADEPASVLLERIREERRRLVAEGKLKAPKGGESVIYRSSDGGYYEKRIDAKGRESEPVCIDDEIPFEIPEGWEWSRLGSICNYGQCVNIDFKDIEDETWILELEQIERDTGLVVEKVRKHGGVGSTKHLFKKGDVLYSKLRPYLNKVVIADEDGAATSEIFPLDFLGQIDAQYVQIALMSPYFIDYADSCSYGVKMPRLGTSDGQHALLPVPPRSEQDRIAGFVNAALPLVTSR